MFINDHVCDPERLRKMVVNSSGQRAEMISGQHSKEEQFECDICKEVFKGILPYADHMQAHELKEQEDKLIRQRDEEKRQERARV